MKKTTEKWKIKQELQTAQHKNNYKYKVGNACGKWGEQDSNHKLGTLSFLHFQLLDFLNLLKVLVVLKFKK